jgi:hypothetical protein
MTNSFLTVKMPEGDDSQSLEPGFKLRVILTFTLFVIGITGIAFWWALGPAQRGPRDYLKGNGIPYLNLVQPLTD